MNLREILPGWRSRAGAAHQLNSFHVNLHVLCASGNVPRKRILAGWGVETHENSRGILPGRRSPAGAAHQLNSFPVKIHVFCAARGLAGAYRGAEGVGT